jgi:hypothetical protein
MKHIKHLKHTLQHPFSTTSSFYLDEWRLVDVERERGEAAGLA